MRGDFGKTGGNPFNNAMPVIINQKHFRRELAECMARCEDDLHVFAYGSLMWRPGFAVRWAAAARIYGYSRRLAVKSTHYRGAPDNPGLVFGLDLGGSCCGVVLRAAAGKNRVLPPLFRREMFANVYEPKFLRARLLDGGGVKTVLTFAVRRGHPQYAPPIPPPQAAKIIRNAKGAGGENAEYILNTFAELKRRGVHCPQLEKLCALLK